MIASSLSWTPGAGGLLAHLHGALDVPHPGVPAAVTVRPLHVTLLGRRSVAPLMGASEAAVQAVFAQAPPPPPLVWAPALHLAERGPHPDKDPPSETRPRRTWFVVPVTQGVWRRYLLELVGRIDDVVGGFPHPEPQRFFHVSVFNNRGGEGWRSIGDIGPEDLRAPG